jgi:hypothetical protein
MASPVTVVFARCRDVAPGGSSAELARHGFDFLVYQKRPCNTSTADRARLELAKLERLGRVVGLDHNRGDECSVYLRFIVDHYDRLPDVSAFLQYGAERQLILPSAFAAVNATLGATRKHGFASLSRHSFEGSWPAPCEPAQAQSKFMKCSTQVWRDLGVAPPPSFRFYANGLFAVTRERIRARPRAFYAAMLGRLSGKDPARCSDGPDTRASRGSQRAARVGDCHVLEKAWHVLFGEPATLAPPHLYNAWRAPDRALRLGGRFYETKPRGKCEAGIPPGEIGEADAMADARRHPGRR